MAMFDQAIQDCLKYYRLSNSESKDLYSIGERWHMPDKKIQYIYFTVRSAQDLTHEQTMKELENAGVHKAAATQSYRVEVILDTQRGDEPGVLMNLDL